MTHSRSLLACPVALSLLLVPSAQGVTVNLGALQDNTIYDDGVGDLSNGLGAGLFAGRNGMGQTTRALIAFDIASVVPAGSTITGVSLRLVKGAGPTSAHTISLYNLTADWGEGTTLADGGGGGGGPATPGSATWVHTFFNTQNWTTPGGDFDAAASASTSVSAIGTYTWASATMVADVQAWLDSGATNFGWILRGTETGNGTASRFASREHPTPASRPLLTIDYVPSPGTACLFAAGACTMVRRRRLP